MNKSRRNYSKLRSKKAKRINKTRRYKTKRINKTKRRYSKQSRRLRKNNKTKKKSKKIIGGAYPLTIFNQLTSIQDLLRDGMVLRLVRHGLPNSNSGISAFGGIKIGKFKWLSSMGYHEPTLYFDKNFMPVDVGGIKQHRIGISMDRPRSTTEGMERLRKNLERGIRHDLHKTSLFHFPVREEKEQPEQTEPINLVVFVSPFLRTLETMLEMMSSAIITIREGGGQVDGRFKITVIIGPFTEIKPLIDVGYGNLYNPTTITRFLGIIKKFNSIYLTDIAEMVDPRNVEIELFYCSGNIDMDTGKLNIRILNLPQDGSGSADFSSAMDSPIYKVYEHNTKAGKDFDLLKCLESVLSSDMPRSFSPTKVLELVKTDYFSECRVVTHSNRIKKLFTDDNNDDNPTVKPGFLESLLIYDKQKSAGKYLPWEKTISNLRSNLAAFQEPMRTKKGYSIKGSQPNLVTRFLPCVDQMNQAFLQSKYSIIENNE